MWIWNTDNVINDFINDVGNTRQELYDFCRSPHGNPDHKIEVLFINFSEAIVNSPENLRSFLTDAHENGFIIEYLDGDPSWATYNQQAGLERLNRVIEFNNQVTMASEKIDGIQFDVEPYLLKSTSNYSPPYWDVDMDSVWNLFVDYTDTCQRIVDDADTSLYFGIAIPRWYENHVGIWGLNRLQSKVDYVAIMDYNERSSVIISDAENEINNAVALNKKVWIGVETKNVYPETVSFYEEGVAYMETELEKVISAYSDFDVFQGIAIHAYAYYKNLSSNSIIRYPEKSDGTFDIYQNYENPVRNGTMIRYGLPNSMPVEIDIFNILGQNVSSLVNGQRPVGENAVYWDARQFAPGLYFCRIKTPVYEEARKILLIR